MDDIVLNNSEISEILEKPEEPILTLNFKCDSNDYRYSEEMWSERINISSTRGIRIRSFLFILFWIFIALFTSPYGINYSKYYHFVWVSAIISLIIVSFNIYIIYCCKHKYTYFMHIRTGKRIKSFTLVYENRTKKEIKKIIIPCKYRFYNTYFIKSSPLPETMYKTSAEEIVNVPLTEDIPIEYSLIKNIYENKKCITFSQRIFFPKDQLNEHEKEQLNLIINKICIENNIKRPSF